MTFEEIITLLREGVEPDPSVYDDLSGLYSTSESKFSAASAKAKELTTTIEALNSEISALKSQIYDLLMQIEGEPEENAEGNPEDEEPEDINIEDLFE